MGSGEGRGRWAERVVCRNSRLFEFFRLGVPADKRGLEVAVFGDGSFVGRRLSADQEPVMRRIKPVETSNQ